MAHDQSRLEHAAREHRGTAGRVTVTSARELLPTHSVQHPHTGTGKPSDQDDLVGLDIACSPRSA